MTTLFPSVNLTTPQDGERRLTEGEGNTNCAADKVRLFHEGLKKGLSLDDAFDYGVIMHKQTDHRAGVESSQMLAREIGDDAAIEKEIARGWNDRHHSEITDKCLCLYRKYRSWGFNQANAGESAVRPFMESIQAELNQQMDELFYQKLADATDDIVPAAIKPIMQESYKTARDSGAPPEMAALYATQKAEEALSKQNSADDDEFGWIPPHLRGYVQ